MARAATPLAVTELEDSRLKMLELRSGEGPDGAGPVGRVAVRVHPRDGTWDVVVTRVSLDAPPGPGAVAPSPAPQSILISLQAGESCIRHFWLQKRVFKTLIVAYSETLCFVKTQCPRSFRPRTQIIRLAGTKCLQDCQNPEVERAVNLERTVRLKNRVTAAKGRGRG